MDRPRGTHPNAHFPSRHNQTRAGCLIWQDILKDTKEADERAEEAGATGEGRGAEVESVVEEIGHVSVAVDAMAVKAGEGEQEVSPLIATRYCV